MQTLFLVCGIPMSGKTTVAKEIAARENAVTLSFDKIKEDLFGPDIVLGKDSEVFSAMRTLFDKALDSGRNIVIDSCNPFPNYRRGYAVRARKRGLHTVCVFCHKHYAYAITASMMRGGKYHDKAIRKAFDIFIPPERNEGWAEIRVNDGNRYSLEVEGQIPVERRTFNRSLKKSRIRKRLRKDESNGSAPTD